MKRASVVLTVWLFVAAAPAAVGQSPARVDDFREWCGRIAGSASAAPATVRFDDEAIRADFVRRYDNIVLADVARRLFGEGNIDNPTIRKLRDMKSVGVWRRGNTLYIADSFVQEATGFQDRVDRYVHYLTEVLKPDGRAKMQPFYRCVFTAMHSYFSRLVFLGGERRRAAIELRFHRRDAFAK